MLAVAELMRNGAMSRLNSRAYCAPVSGANRAGGLLAASASRWKDVSTIQATGATKSSVSSQAIVVQTGPAAVPVVLSSASRFVIGRPLPGTGTR